MIKLELLSNAAKKLGFKKMKSTLDKISEVDLKLDKELESELKAISSSLWTIIDKNCRLDTKIKEDTWTIKCESVDKVLEESKNLLEEIYLGNTKEEINNDLKKAEIAIKEYNDEDELNDTELLLALIRDKNEIKKRFKNITLLEEIIVEISDFREQIIVILENIVEKEGKQKVEVKKKELVIEKKIIEKSVANKNEILLGTNTDVLVSETKKIPKLNNLQEVEDFYNNNSKEDFIVSLDNVYSDFDVNIKLDICFFLYNEKFDKGDLNKYFLKIALIRLRSTEDNNRENRWDKIDSYINERLTSSQEKALYAKKVTKPTKIKKEKLETPHISTNNTWNESGIIHGIVEKKGLNILSKWIKKDIIEENDNPIYDLLKFIDKGEKQYKNLGLIKEKADLFDEFSLNESVWIITGNRLTSYLFIRFFMEVLIEKWAISLLLNEELFSVCNSSLKQKIIDKLIEWWVNDLNSYVFIIDIILNIENYTNKTEFQVELLKKYNKSIWKDGTVIQENGRTEIENQKIEKEILQVKEEKAEKIIEKVQNVEEKKPKTQEKKFVDETWSRVNGSYFEVVTWYELNETCFKWINISAKIIYIKWLVEYKVENLEKYDYIYNFFIKNIEDASDSDVLTDEFILEYAPYFWLELNVEAETNESMVEEVVLAPEKKEKKVHFIRSKKEENNEEKELANIDSTPASLYEAWYKTVPGLAWKTKQLKPKESTHNKWKTLIWKEGVIEKITVSLDYHFPLFLKNEELSDIFIKYINIQKESNDFVRLLSNKVIKSSSSFISIFFEELEKLNLNKDFYSKMLVFVWQIDIEDKEKKTEYLKILSQKGDINYVLKEENFEEKVDEENIDEILKKWTKTLYDWIDIFKWYNNPDFLIQRYKKQLVTTIRENKSYNNETKITYFNEFREAFIRNFNRFENPEDIVKYVRRLDINLQKLWVEQSISDIQIILKEIEKLNEINEASLVIENNVVEEIKLLPYLRNTPVVDTEEEDIENEQEENTKPNETPKWSFNLDFLDSNTDFSWISKFLDNLRKHISEDEWFFELLKKAKDNKEKQEQLFNLLLIDKSQNERNFLSYLAFQIGKQSESTSDEVNNVVTTIDELQEQINKLIEDSKDKEEYILKIQRQSQEQIEELKNELSWKDQEIARLTKELESYKPLKDEIIEDAIDEWLIDNSAEELPEKVTDINNIERGWTDEVVETDDNPYWRHFWENRGRMSIEEKVSVLINIESIENLILFYNQLESKFKWSIMSIKQQNRATEWIEFFELFILKFNEFWKKNKDLSETKVKLIGFILENLGNNIKKLNWEKVPKKSLAKNTENVFDVTKWRDKQVLRTDKKLLVLESLTTYEDFKEFYDRFKSWFILFISTSKKQEDTKEVAINLFNTFINCFNRLKWDDSVILEELNNNIKKLNWEFIAKKRVTNWPVKKKVKKHEVKNWIRVMSDVEIEEARDEMFWLNKSEEDKGIEEIEKELSKELNDKPSLKKTSEELSRAKNNILTNLSTKWTKLNSKWTKPNSKKTWYEIWIEKLEKLKTKDFDTKYLTKVIWWLKNEDISKYFHKVEVGEWDDVEIIDMMIIWKNIEIKLTDSIKEVIYNKFNKELILIDEELKLFEKLTDFMLKLPRKTSGDKILIKSNLENKKEK